MSQPGSKANQLRRADQTVLLADPCDPRQSRGGNAGKRRTIDVVNNDRIWGQL